MIAELFVESLTQKVKLVGESCESSGRFPQAQEHNGCSSGLFVSHIVGLHICESAALSSLEWDTRPSDYNVGGSPFL